MGLYSALPEISTAFPFIRHQDKGQTRVTKKIPTLLLIGPYPPKSVNVTINPVDNEEASASHEVHGVMSLFGHLDFDLPNHGK